MGFSDYMRIANLNNLKLRNTYRRVFKWRNKNKLGFNGKLKVLSKKESLLLKLRLKKATDKRLLKIRAYIIFLMLMLLVVLYLLEILFF